ncbi:MAG: response regulator [Verrucomicrobiota bacterium]
MTASNPILVVDDTEIARKVVRGILESEGLRVLEAADGLEALAVLESTPCAALITDVLMPNMDGFALCHQLRKRAEFQVLPILVYTSTYNSPSDEKMARVVGADKYLVKPAARAVLLQTVSELLKAQEERPQPGKTLPDDLVVMREYNAVLVRKLEERNQDLEHAQSELLRANHKLQSQTDELSALNGELEKRVSIRTAELAQKNVALERALAEVKQLSGLLPICACCKKIRDDQNYWHSVESFITERSDARFSHGYCPACLETVVQRQLREMFPDAPDAPIG